MGEYFSTKMPKVSDANVLNLDKLFNLSLLLSDDSGGTIDLGLMESDSTKTLIQKYVDDNSNFDFKSFIRTEFTILAGEWRNLLHGYLMLVNMCCAEEKDYLEWDDKYFLYMDTLDKIESLKEYAHTDKVRRDVENIEQYIRMTLHVAKVVLLNISKNNQPGEAARVS